MVNIANKIRIYTEIKGPIYYDIVYGAFSEWYCRIDALTSIIYDTSLIENPSSIRRTINANISHKMVYEKS